MVDHGSMIHKFAKFSQHQTFLLYSMVFYTKLQTYSYLPHVLYLHHTWSTDGRYTHSQCTVLWWILLTGFLFSLFNRLVLPTPLWSSKENGCEYNYTFYVSFFVLSCSNFKSMISKESNKLYAYNYFVCSYTIKYKAIVFECMGVLIHIPV